MPLKASPLTKELLDSFLKLNNNVWKYFFKIKIIDNIKAKNIIALIILR